MEEELALRDVGAKIPRSCRRGVERRSLCSDDGCAERARDCKCPVRALLIDDHNLDGLTELPLVSDARERLAKNRRRLTRRDYDRDVRRCRHATRLATSAE